MKLIIANKNYSSWSMRPWVLLKEFKIHFEEVKISFEPENDFSERVRSINPIGKVPIVIDDDDFAIWDSLAIVEFVSEKFKNLNIWPENFHDRARARCLCAEMHAGFQSLRQLCPMNIDADLSSIGPELFNKYPQLVKDLERFDQIASDCKNSGPFLFGKFCAVDAYFSPIAMRITRYGLPMSVKCKKYVDALCNLESVCIWVNDAVQEKQFLSCEELYRKSFTDLPTI